MGRRPTQIGHAPPPLTVVGSSPPVQEPGEGDDGEEERTTVDDAPVAPRITKAAAAAAARANDDQWEEGTTVEEATSADPPPGPPAIGVRNHLALRDENSSTGDELAVDDQARPLPPLALVPPTPAAAAAAARPRPAEARLIVIAGNDSGKSFNLTATPMTIGRAVDNDIVLTDIAVSRKHLDLSFDGAFYSLRDRGSGNGTLLNDRIEDGLCRLHQGDRIEIGNTVFRFEQAVAAATAAQLGWGDRDEDEASTMDGRVAGRLPDPLPRPGPGLAVPLRPAALPTINAGGAVPVAAAAAATAPASAAGDRPRAPLPPPGGRQRPGPSQPPPVGDAARLVLPPTPPGATPGADDGRPFVVPATAAAVPPPVVLASGAKSLAAMSAMAMIPPRQLTTTALVEPRAYDPVSITAPVVRPYPYVLRPESSRRRFVLGAAIVGSALLVGLVAMLLTSDGGDDDDAPIAAAASPIAVDWGTDETVLSPRRAVVRPIGETAAPTPPVTPTPATSPDAAPAPTTAPIEAPTAPTAPTAASATTAVPAPSPPTPTTPPSATPSKVAATLPTPTKPAPAPTLSKPAPTTDTPKRQAPEKVTRDTRRDDAAERREPKRRTDTKPAAKPDAKPAKGAAKVTAARKKAAKLYAARDWGGAAEVLRDTVDLADDDASVELEELADTYEAVGAAIAQGNAASSTRPTEAMAAYNRALGADKRAGGALASMLREKLGQIAPKAAGSFMAKGNYEAAKRAADTAVNYGFGDSAAVVQVRQSLERKAGDLYNGANRLMASKPTEAKAQLRRILKIVPADSPWYTKAFKALKTGAPRSR